MHITEQAVPLPVAKRSTRRRKLWELQRRFHCSIIGTCTTLEELRQIVSRCGIVMQATPGDYELHGAFVNMADTACLASRQVQKLLDRRHQREIRIYTKVRSEPELTQLWETHLAEGQVAGAYWALMTHPFVSVELAAHAHGEIHMLSHRTAAGHSDTLKRTAALERRCAELEEQLATATARSARQLAERDTTLRKLNARLIEAMDAERQLQFAEHRIRRLEGSGEFQQVRKSIRELNQQLDDALRRTERADTQNARLTEELQLLGEETRSLRGRTQRQEENIRVLESELKQALNSEGEEPLCPADCGNLDLGGQCVLYVGGRSSQCAHFRTLVERHNGRFLHHDGGREDSSLRLGSVLPRADAILCPVDCVSHEAYHRIKRFSEQHTKRLVLMPRASLSAFTRGLMQVSA